MVFISHQILAVFIIVGKACCGHPRSAKLHNHTHLVWWLPSAVLPPGPTNKLSPSSVATHANTQTQIINWDAVNQCAQSGCENGSHLVARKSKNNYWQGRLVRNWRGNRHEAIATMKLASLEEHVGNNTRKEKHLENNKFLCSGMLAQYQWCGREPVFLNKSEQLFLVL